MTGTYTSPERVERDGRLVAFAGEVMTMDEAVARGLVAEKEPAQRKGRKPKASAGGSKEA
jgi:hypothetical protein